MNRGVLSEAGKAQVGHESQHIMVTIQHSHCQHICIEMCEAAGEYNTD